MEVKMNTENRRINRYWLAVLLLAALLAACNGGGEPEATGATVETITLERQPCFGFCPVYTLALHGDGRVEYNGLENVAVTGPQSGTVDPAAVQALADEMAAAGYFDWEDAYLNQEVTDNPYAITSITLSDGTTKQIEHYYGDSSAPEALTALETRIDETANVAQWVGETQQ
jgi:hypothetical protein